MGLCPGVRSSLRRSWASVWHSSVRNAIALVSCLVAGLAGAVDVRVLAPNAVKESITTIAGRYELASGNLVIFAWAGTESITKRVSEGEVFDVVVNAAQNIDSLVAEGRLVTGSRTDFAKSAIGVAVQAGLPRPDVATVDALRQTVLKANSIAISSGTSGRHVADVFQRLGIANQIKNKIKQPPSGSQIAELLARGEAELGFQQVSELLHASGVDFLGSLPTEIQSYTIYSAGLHASASEPEAARDFMKTLASPASVEEIKKTGMESM